MDDQDILRDLSHLALASRLKRLADAMLADAAKIHSASGEPLQIGQFPLIAALDRYGPMSVNAAAAALGISQPATTRAINEAIKSGLVISHSLERDKRRRELSLTPLGRDCIARLKSTMWPRVEAAARQLTKDTSGTFLDHIDQIERRLKEASMYERVSAIDLSIVDFSDELAHHFHDINLEWIETMFTLEPHDEDVLLNPKKMIIDKGGDILFVRRGETDILGACALALEADGFIELTKMCVRSSARGRGAGEFLLRAAIERARQRYGVEKLFLVSNKRNVEAVKLYEKLGFEHDTSIMEKFGDRYERCDVAMRYRGP